MSRNAPKKKSLPSAKVPAPRKANPANVIPPPSVAELVTILGDACAAWWNVLRTMEKHYAPIEVQWRKARTLEFGRYSILRHKDRTLLYMLPSKNKAEVSLILGQRAFEEAMASDLRLEIKQALSEARPYAEGRGIRFEIEGAGDLEEMLKLLACKLGQACELGETRV